MKKVLFILFILFVSANCFSQRKTKVETVKIKPINGKGFSGSVDFVYAFSNCFGDVQMLYTYRNVNITGFYYDNKFFTAQDLEIESFDKYLLTPDFTIKEIKKVTNFSTNGTPHPEAVNYKSLIKSDVVLKYTLDTQLAGCYGQTYKIGSYKKINISRSNTIDNIHLEPNYLYLKSLKAYFKWNDLLSDRAKCKLNPDCKLTEETDLDKKQSDTNLVEKKSIVTVTYKFDATTQNGLISPNEANFYFEINCTLSNTIKKKLTEEGKKTLKTIKMFDFRSLQICINCPSSWSYHKISNFQNIELSSIAIDEISVEYFYELLNKEDNYSSVNSFGEREQIKEGAFKFEYGYTVYYPNFVPNCNIFQVTKESNDKEKKSYWNDSKKKKRTTKKKSYWNE